ncbi:uncharacterized protein LOC129568939 [Sitodiplosis mosellana]|uniref:uncharacterized protein LOC129568939 n=1 Tax=Sitodiplosis mosellana TaxID=263140 RepID=UPI002444961F|nr:uncharacterized protein LOC129568939 [Sitodiplosis mosellana]
MKLPTIGHFCCCVDLITAGKIIGWLGIVSGVLSIIGGFKRLELFLDADVSIALSACWLYGIEKSRPSYLLPTVLLTTIGVVSLYIFDVLFLPFAVYIAATSEKPIKFESIRLASIVLFVILMTMLATYFWVVTNSVYAAVKERSQKLPTVYHGVSRGVSHGTSKVPA